MVAFTSPQQVTSGLAGCAAVSGMLAAGAMSALFDGAAAYGASRRDAQALDAWGDRLHRAEGNASRLAGLARALVTEVNRWRTKAASVEAENARLRKALAQREAIIARLGAAA